MALEGSTRRTDLPLIERPEAAMGCRRAYRTVGRYLRSAARSPRVSWQDGVVAQRCFPFTPRTTRQMERGDIIGVPCDPDGWVCLQVVDLIRSGPGFATTFVVAALPWSSTQAPPTAAAVAGLGSTEHGLTRIELFTEGHAQVFGNAPVKDVGLPSNFGDFQVGTTHEVWGWRTAIRKAQAAAIGPPG